ncbi:hypothetical protein LVY65_12435 [Sphingomonas sp. G124]|uniref:Uncharacterized protein n=1 Tax=Sphingomonas cremea TaxID=2904799 RepID=A0A9X1QNQ6_9SPHN|nr:hypothetical protein [Sphingomonas cremea]MCF2515864.1 hypothetical protein [Sphingomonas cremea]
MLGWLNLATVSGAITIVAFIAECLKAFPRYAEFRRGFLLVSFGVFVGSIITATSGLQIVLSPDGSPLALLMALCIGLGLVFLFLGVMAEMRNRKNEFYALSAFSVGGFLLFMFIYGMSQAGGNTMTLGELTFREKVWLGEQALSKGDDERAIEMLEDAARDLTTGDPREVALAQKIQVAKKRQLQRDMEIVR